MCSRSGSRIAALEIALPGLSLRDRPQDAAPPGEHPNASVSTFLTTKAAARFQRNGSVEHRAHLPLSLYDLSVHRIRECGAAAVGDREVT